MKYMEFDADLELTAAELAHLFEMILEGLRSENKFELPIGNSKFEMFIGSEKVQSTINIANINNINRLIFGFQWREPSVSTTTEEIPPAATKSVQVFEDEPVTTAEEIFAADEALTRNIPMRMILQTTTFGNDVGYYISAFSPEDDSVWEEVSDPEQGLAHEKWNTQIQHEGIPSIGEFDRRKKKSADLFEDLDSKPLKKQVKNKTTKKKSYITEPKLNRTATAPPPAAVAKTTEEVEWHEPSRDEIATNDDWVKPSEILQQTQGGEIASLEKEDTIVEEKTLKPSVIAELADDKPPEPPRPKKPKTAPESPDKKKGWASWD